MTYSDDECRAAFERWHSSVFEEELVWVPERNLYRDFGHQEAWRGWQAARNVYIPQVGDWRPIETALRDGTELLLFDPTYREYRFVGKFENGDWYCTEYDAFIKEPTHWMPLPAPPSTGKDGGDE